MQRADDEFEFVRVAMLHGKCGTEAFGCRQHRNVQPVLEQLDPSLEREAVKEFPLRTRRTQCGAAPADPVESVVPPAVGRHWSPDVPFPRISIIA